MTGCRLIPAGSLPGPCWVLCWNEIPFRWHSEPSSAPSLTQCAWNQLFWSYLTCMRKCVSISCHIVKSWKLYSGLLYIVLANITERVFNFTEQASEHLTVQLSLWAVHKAYNLSRLTQRYSKQTDPVYTNGEEKRWSPPSAQSHWFDLLHFHLWNWVHTWLFGV